MNNKATGVYFMVFAALYFGYTIFIAGHGIHRLNAVIAIGALVSGIYFILKGRKTDK